MEVDFGQSINIDQNKERTKNRALWHIRNDWGRQRRFTINHNSLGTICQMVSNPMPYINIKANFCIVVAKQKKEGL